MYTMQLLMVGEGGRSVYIPVMWWDEELNTAIWEWKQYMIEGCRHPMLAGEDMETDYPPEPSKEHGHANI